MGKCQETNKGRLWYPGQQWQDGLTRQGAEKKGETYRLFI